MWLTLQIVNMTVMGHKFVKAQSGNSPATLWQFTGQRGISQATYHDVNSQLKSFGDSPVFPLQVQLQVIYFHPAFS